MDFFAIPITDIVSPLTRLVNYIVKLEKNVESLKKAMEDLIDARDDVKAKVEYSERQGLIRTNVVSSWLRRAEAIEGEVYEIVGAFNQRRTFPENCCPNWWSSYELGKRVAGKLQDVVELKNNCVFEEVASPVRVTEKPSTFTVGMDPTMAKVLCCLEEVEVGVVGIFGMGGVGKTTLLKKIYNKFGQRSEDFEVVIWVLVGKEANVENIQRVIATKLGFSLPDNQYQGAAVIFNVLRRKTFLLFLDDVWQRLDLENVGIPHPNKQNECKVIFTTRSLAVCRSMEAQREIKVEPLEWSEAWDLFQLKAAKAIKSHPEIPKYAETIAQRCGGLPQALISVGLAMASRITPQEWNHAISILSMSPWEITGMENEVLPLLKHSYDSLRDDTIKACFLYCSLFPEGYNISISQLIEYWIGEGFLEEGDDLDLAKAHDKGRYIIGSLKYACLLEDGDNKETEMKMHCVVRDLALWIASDYGSKKNKFLVLAGVELTKVPLIERWEEAERISLIGNKLEALMETPTCPRLFTLMLQENRQLSKISDIFMYMPSLRVLDLSFTNLKEFPIGIGYLFGLQHLNLSHTQIETLPGELTNLHQLQYLNLSHTQIKALPGGLTNLIKLKHLNLNYTICLETIPREVLPWLLKLRVLTLDHSGYDTCGLDLADLEHLKQLSDHGIMSIKRSLPAAHSSHWPQIITMLAQDGGDIDYTELTCFELLSIFRDWKSLEVLGISNCDELEVLVIGTKERENQLLSNLGSLSLQYLFKLATILVHHRSLQNLRFVNIVGCIELKNLTWIQHLQCLERISLLHCYEMEEVIGCVVNGADEEPRVFPRLKVIYIKSLPVLKRICRQMLVFPSLQYFIVSYCPKLKELPVGLDNSKTLQEIRGEKKWWDRLVWKDESFKSNFHHYFVEYEEF